jgi:hypothetical protein
VDMASIAGSRASGTVHSGRAVHDSAHARGTDQNRPTGFGEAGDSAPVWGPDAGLGSNTTHEALRDLVRARVDASMHLMRARQQLLAFLLRHGRSYPTGKHWTQRHRCWMAGQTFREQAPRHRLSGLSGDGVDRPGSKRCPRQEDFCDGCNLVPRTPCRSFAWFTRRRPRLRGYLHCLTGDLSRFESPRLLMGYLGLVPSEHSSGGTIRRGGITKTGNREARRMLIEAAWSYQYPARIAKEKAEILVRLPKSIPRHRMEGADQVVCPLPVSDRQRQKADRRRRCDRARTGRASSGPSVRRCALR